MIYGSVCSGIEAASVAWRPLGWRCSFVSEIDAFPRAVLAHHYPETPLHGDFTTIDAGQYEAIDVLVGGTPCQSFSVAGLGAGLSDDRGKLALEFALLAYRLRPRWIVWENVPGVFSKDEGRAFGSILGALAECGYGLAWRVLDAQYFGLAQRRKRVFVVGYLGDWRRAAAVLFERESLSGNPPPSRETRKDVAPTISARPTAGGGLGTDFDLDGGLIAAEVCETLRAGGNRTGGDRPPGTDADTAATYLIAYGGNNTAGPIDVATAVNAHGGPHGRLDFESETFIAHSLRGEGFDASEDGTGRGTPLVPVAFSIMPMNSGKDFKGREVDVAQPVMAAGPGGGNQGGDYVVQPAVSALRAASGGSTRDYIAFSSKDHGADATVDLSPTLRASGHTGSHANAGAPPAIATRFAVRRLTPTECERLQGFPDGYTAIPYRGKPAADGPRYKALGNSMAVPVMAWIGRRIAAVDAR